MKVATLPLSSEVSAPCGSVLFLASIGYQQI